MARHGFDPIGDVSLKIGPGGKLRGGSQALVIYTTELAQRLNLESPGPVVLFDPQHRSVRLLTKNLVTAPNGAGDTATGPAPPKD